MTHTCASTHNRVPWPGHSLDAHIAVVVYTVSFAYEILKSVDLTRILWRGEKLQAGGQGVVRGEMAQRAGPCGGIHRNSDEETKRIASLASSDDLKRLEEAHHAGNPNARGKQPATSPPRAKSGPAAPKEIPLPELPRLELAAGRFSDEYTLNFDRPLGVGRNGAVIEATHTNSKESRWVNSLDSPLVLRETSTPPPSPHTTDHTQPDVSR